MKDFYGSAAVIDAKMCLKNADEALYQFIGQDMYAPITNSVHPEDVHKLEEAVEELQDKDMPKNVTLIRMKSRAEEFIWSAVEITCLPFETKQGVLFRIVFQEPGASSASELAQINQEYEDLFGLLEGILLVYVPDEEYLEIYERESGQRIYWFQGSIKEWQDSMRDKVEPGHLSEFEALCIDLKEGKTVIQHNVMIKDFLNSEEMGSYVFKGRLIHNVAGKSKIVGFIKGYYRGGDILQSMEDNRDAGLPVLNKKAIIEYAKRAMLMDRGKVCLVILDLDDFKTINDTFGHMFGDEVLSKTVEVLKEALGTQGVVGRIGGDELMLVFNRVESDSEIRNMLRTIRTNVEWSYRGKRDDLRVTCSIGAAVYPDHGRSYEQIFEIADRMLYIAKKKGKNRYVIYVPEIHDNQEQQTEKAAQPNTMKYYRGDKAGVMQRFIERFLVKRNVTFEKAITEVGYCFELDEIVLSQGAMPVATTWNHKGLFQDIEEKELIWPEESFLESFDKNNLFVMNNIFDLEGKSKDLAERLKQKGVESALFYKYTEKNSMKGYIMFAKKKRRQMWSEEDKVLLGLIGKAMELSAV